MSLVSNTPLPTPLDELQQRCALLQQTLDDKECELAMHRQLLRQRDQQIEALQEKLSLLLAKRYSHSSEKLDGMQGSLFDEAELQAEIDHVLAAIAAREAQQNNTVETGADKPTRSTTASGTDKPKRKPLPTHLRRVTVDVDVSPEDKQMMGDEWVQIGWESSEQLAIQERESYVKVLRRAKYIKKTASSDPVSQPSAIKLAPVVPVILPRAIADASLLAKIITGKFVDAKSFYREMKVLARDGVELGYSTVCSYPIQLAAKLEPMKRLLYEQAGRGARLHLDETTLQVMGEPDRAQRSHSYLWALRGGPLEAPVVLFHYDPRRNFEALHAWLEPLLGHFHGVIVTDEHKPYQRLADTQDGIIVRGGCWSHCRRKYADAVKGRRHTSDAHVMLKHIALLYKLEAKTKHLTGEAKLEQRQKLVAPQLLKIRAAAEALAAKYIDKGLMQNAIGYTLNNWASLSAFVDHADLPIDNNPIENAIRPFTVGRRNWLFSGSPRGAHASAFMYSLIETAKANGWEPRAYLNALFERYPTAKTEEERRQLLPMFLAKT